MFFYCHYKWCALSLFVVFFFSISRLALRVLGSMRTTTCFIIISTFFIVVVVVLLSSSSSSRFFYFNKNNKHSMNWHASHSMWSPPRINILYRNTFRVAVIQNTFFTKINNEKAGQGRKKIQMKNKIKIKGLFK